MKRLIITATVFLVGLLGHSNSQENMPSPQEALEKVKDIANIPELNNLNVSALPIEEVRQQLQQKCEKNGGPTAFDNAIQAKAEAELCLKSLINVTELQAEMEQATPHGDLDVVFKKYCQKSPTLRKCILNFTTAIEPCLDAEEVESKQIILNITDSLLGFVCFKEGDRIALFISTKGPECFQSKQQAIQNCANTTLGNFMKSSNAKEMDKVTFDRLPTLRFGPNECSAMTKLQECIVPELEHCEDPTPANIVDSIFNFVRKVTPCHNFEHRSDNANAAGNIISQLMTTLLFAMLLYFV